MSTSIDWIPAEPNLEAILAHHNDPLLALSKADIPAIILRQAYNTDQCSGLIRRFIDTGLMRNPTDARSQDQRTRIDIGTSLGNRGNDKERFLEHAQSTHFLFNFLFDNFDDPVKVIYDSLSRLGGDKVVKVAREPDGRLYGPAIFRIHYESHTYRPHIDHVRLREGRFNYAVHRFEHQFAGVICFQNADERGEGTQAILHRCLWTEELQPHIAEGTFHQYADEKEIENYRVMLEPGDLYFFNTRCIHEVPPVSGNNPRIVLAVFIGYSPDDDEIFVWS